ncbi:MAG: sugar ABC transporter permease [Clostridiales bacterium]|nr:sugar ABC transporter permease [Clostridiales bacterium]
MDRVLSDKKAIILMVLPALIIFVSVVFIPVIWTFVYSFYSGMPGLKFQFTGFSNYINMWSNEQTMDAIKMNWKYILIVTPGQIGLGLLVSLMMYFSIKKYKTLCRTIVFIPTVLPTVAVAQMFAKMYEMVPNYGLINSLLNLVGLDQWIQPFLGQPNTAFAALCAMDVWTAIGFYTVIIYGALVDIPNELLEAARIDGASGVKLFTKIVLPMIRTIMITCLVFSFTGTIKLYESATALTKGGPGFATTSMTMNMYQNAFLYDEYGYASTVAILILIQCLLVTFLINMLSREKY